MSEFGIRYDARYSASTNVDLAALAAALGISPGAVSVLALVSDT